MNGQGGGGLFALLGGFPAQVLVVLGVLLVLVGMAVPGCQAAGAASARAAVERAGALMEMDLEALRDQQEQERRASAAASAATGQPPDATMETRHQEALRAQREQLKQQYAITQLRRDAVESSAAASGSRTGIILATVGRILLVLGLLILAVAADGRAQVVLGSALVVVLLATLSGFMVGFGAGAGVPDIPMLEGGNSPAR
jgi:hypothetical protein